MRHTHRTDSIRSDFDLLAMCVLLTFNGKEPTPSVIEAWEADYRGHPKFEEALRKAADLLRQAVPDFKAEQHQCGGQLCDQDGKYDVSIVTRKSEA
jgi:hypothetical protein